MILAAEFPQLLIAIIVLEATSCQLEGEHGDVKVQLDVYVVQLLLKEPQLLYLDEGIAVLVHVLVIALMVEALVVRDVALVDVAERAELVIVLLVLPRQHRVNQVLLVRLDLGLIEWARLPYYSLLYVVERRLLLHQPLQARLVVAWAQQFVGVQVFKGGDHAEIRHDLGQTDEDILTLLDNERVQLDVNVCFAAHVDVVGVLEEDIKGHRVLTVVWS